MNQFVKAFEPDKLQEAWQVFLTEFPQGLWETVYVTVLATFFAIVLGLPLGILLVTGDEKGIRPLPKPLIASMAMDCGIAANILGASTRTLGKREYGYMLIEIPGGPEELGRALKYISAVPDVAVQVEAEYMAKEATEA